MSFETNDNEKKRNVEPLPEDQTRELLKVMKNDDFYGFKKVVQTYNINVQARIAVNISEKPLWCGPPIICVAAYYQGVTTFNYLQQCKVPLSGDTDYFPRPLLHFAILGGNQSIIQTLLNTEGTDYSYVLRPALKCAFLELSKVIYSYAEEKTHLEPSELFNELTDGKDPLHLAIKSGNLETVQFVYEKIQKIDVDKNPLFDAIKKMRCSSQRKEIIFYLADKCNDILNFDTTKNQTNPLIESLVGWEQSSNNTAPLDLIDCICEKREEDCCKILSLKDENGMTALHYAAKYGNDKACQKLLHAFIQHNDIQSIQIQDKDGRTPLFHCVSRSNMTQLKYFLDCFTEPAQVLIPNNLGLTPVHVAARINWKEGFQFLLEKYGKNVLHNPDKSGLSPIAWAAIYGSASIFEVLLSTNLDDIINDQADYSGKTILHWVALNGHEELLESLLKSEKIRKSLINTTSNQNETPLTLAAQKGYLKICEKLLGYGAQVNQANINALTEEIKDLLTNVKK